MGFHPFSDGLPYAPESKSKAPPSPTGTGATAAGRPRFTAQAASRPTTRTARQMQSASTPIQTGFPIHTQSQIQPQIQPARERPQQSYAQTQSRPITSTSISSTPVTHEESDISIIRKRFFAYLLDAVVHSGFWIGTNLAALFFFKFQIDGEIVRDNSGQFLVFFLISQWIFIALQEVLFENSIGKSFFNLEFRRNHRSLFLRSLVFMIGVSCLGLGFYFRPQDKLGEIQLKQNSNPS